jgi:hypothetical protein
MAEEVDLEELFESMREGESSAISKVVKQLKLLWDDEEWEDIEIFAEEILTDETPKDFITKVLEVRSSDADFVADVVASIDGKRIVHPKDFPIMMEFTTSTREGDNEEFNATRSGRASAALNPDCPPELLATLAKDEMWEIRYRVALNPSATTEILASIIGGSYPDRLDFLSEFLETTVALHKNSDASLLEKLAISENQAVRTAVACNPNASPQMVQQAKALGVSPKFLNDTRLYWWFGDSDWTLADLENLQTE